MGIAPLLIGCSATDRVYRDVTGAARRNGCSASRADFVLQAWSASVTDSGCGRGVAWMPPMLTAPAREPEPGVFNCLCIRLLFERIDA